MLEMFNLEIYGYRKIWLNGYNENANGSASSYGNMTSYILMVL